MRRLDRDTLVRYVETYQRAYGGSSPTYREMADLFGASTSVIAYAVDALVSEGRLAYNGDREKARAIVVPGGVFLTRSDLVRLGVDPEDVDRLRVQSLAELSALAREVA